MKSERLNMTIVNDNLHEYTTTLNGAIVQVYIDLSLPAYMERLDSVYFDCTDVTPILDQNTLAAIAGHIVDVCEEWSWL